MRILNLLFLLFIIALFSDGLGLRAADEGGKLKDSESATHSGDAARHQIVDTYKHPGFKVIQIDLPVLSHYSYLLISGKDALLVDPDRDVSFYMETARREGVEIKGVFLTHSHADFVAGHIEVVSVLKCPIHQNAQSGAGYKINPLKEGSVIRVGTAIVKAMETPGHTPDSLCGAVYSSESAVQPEVVFTGDTLFVGSVGRPDLLEGQTSAAALASMGFDTWKEKLSKLPDSTVILPAHGAGSLCGAHLSDRPFSTMGEEKASNPYLKYTSRSTFITAILEDLSEPPQYFKHNAALNRKGPEMVDWSTPLPPEVTPDETLTDPSRYYIVDLRSADKYAAGHIPGSINIGLRGRLETWVGIMIPWGANLVITGNEAELQEALFRLQRVGYKPGVILLESWKKASLPVVASDLVDPAALYRQVKEGKQPVVVDVRLPNEWMGLRIGTILNLPLNRLEALASKLDPGQPVITVCNSAYRSSLAVGVLERKGFKKVGSLAGGTEAWIAAGLPVIQKNKAGVSPEEVKRDIRLPERLSAAELKRRILDLPGTFDLVDMRPPDLYTDFHLPGSRNVDVLDLMHNPIHLTGTGPLIIVDRDGSLAMAVGGILSQKTARPIKVLYRGLEAYWAESELKAVQTPVPLSPAAPRSGRRSAGHSAPRVGRAPSAQEEECGVLT